MTDDQSYVQAFWSEIGTLSFFGSKVKSHSILLLNFGLTNFPKTYAFDLTTKFTFRGTGNVAVPVELLNAAPLPYNGILSLIRDIATDLWLFLDW